jgi:hypothetical protein
MQTDVAVCLHAAGGHKSATGVDDLSAFGGGQVSAQGDDLAAVYQNRAVGDILAHNRLDICVGNNIGYWKAVLTLIGFDMGYTVAPATPVSEQRLADLKEKLQAIDFFNMI